MPLPKMRYRCEVCSDGPFAPVWHGYNEVCPKAVAAQSVTGTEQGAGEGSGVDAGGDAGESADESSDAGEADAAGAGDGEGGEAGETPGAELGESDAQQDGSAGESKADDADDDGWGNEDDSDADADDDGDADDDDGDTPGEDGSMLPDEKPEPKERGEFGDPSKDDAPDKSEADDADGDEDDSSDASKPDKGERADDGAPPPDEDFIVKIARREAGALDKTLEKTLAGQISAAASAIADGRKADAERMLAEIEKIGADMRDAAVKAATEAVAPLPQVTRIEITVPDVTGRVNVLTGLNHYMFPTALRLAVARRNMALVGGAGSGKTTTGDKIGEALGLSFTPFSCGPTTTEYSITGYRNAAGEYVPGPLFKPWTEGGIFFFDEFDACSAAGVVTMNTALANGFATFPHGTFKRHPDCILMAGMNTFGRGADRMYVGRSQLDAATLNRFFMVPWDYDEQLEHELAAAISGVNAPFAGKANPVMPGIVPEKVRPQTAAAWAAFVPKVRAAIEHNGIRAVAGTRDIIEGSEAIMRAGFTLPEVASMRFWNAMSADDLTRIGAELGAEGKAYGLVRAS